MNPSSPWRLTRRAVLTGAASAGAIAVLEPIAGLAQTLTGDSPTFSRMVGSLAGTSPVLLAPRRFSLVGVEWSRPLSAQIELRALGADGRWSQWVPASTRGHDPDIVRERARLFGEPIWTGPAHSVQLRTAQPVSAVKLHFVDEPTPGGAVAAATMPLAAPILEAGAGQPPIIARGAWAQGHARPAVPASYGNVRLGFVHHTTPNGYRSTDVPAILRSIFVFHRFVRGYHDIAYNFMIDAFGRTWEARAGGIDLPVIGAQAGGYNGVSTGVAVIGSFMNVVPARSAIAALERLLAWKLSLHGLPTRGHVTGSSVPPPPSTRRSLRARTCLSRASPVTATGTRRTVPAMRCTRGCRQFACARPRWRPPQRGSRSRGHRLPFSPARPLSSQDGWRCSQRSRSPVLRSSSSKSPPEPRTLSIPSSPGPMAPGACQRR